MPVDPRSWLAKGTGPIARGRRFYTCTVFEETVSEVARSLGQDLMYWCAVVLCGRNARSCGQSYQGTALGYVEHARTQHTAAVAGHAAVVVRRH